MKKNLLSVLATLIFLGGIALLGFPFILSIINENKQAAVVSDYKTAIKEYDKDKMEEERHKAKVYNDNLRGRVELTDPFDTSKGREGSEEYYTLLSVNGGSVMGAIRIPTIDVELPIYHGTDEETLDKGAGHLEKTSLPIGGESTHTVISAHTGSPIAPFFDDLIELKKGDVFLLDVLDETLAYKVDQIQVVLPHEIDDLALVQGKDYATLVTCTPYGINSHRLLVRGERTDYEEDMEQGKHTNEETKTENRLRMIGIISVVLVIIVILVVFIVRRRNRKRCK